MKSTLNKISKCTANSFLSGLIHPHTKILFEQILNNITYLKVVLETVLSTIRDIFGKQK